MVKKDIALLIVLLFLSVIQVVAQSQNSKIAKLQQLRFDAMVNRDTAYLRKYTDEGLVYIHSNGLVQSQHDFIQSVGLQSIVYQQIKLKEQQVRVYKKAAIINGIVLVKGMFNGKAFDVELRYTDMYVYKKGWKMASWQSLKL
jgi:Domain of unknown function (DUF4440)